MKKEVPAQLEMGQSNVPSQFVDRSIDLHLGRQIAPIIMLDQRTSKWRTSQCGKTDNGESHSHPDARFPRIRYPHQGAKDSRE